MVAAGNAPEPAADGGANAIERNVLLLEVRAILAATAPVARDRHIFWLYYRHGLSTKAIASIQAIALTQKGVESVIQRLTVGIRRHIIQSAMGRREE
jgi:RNA polymerase sigma-70 factor (ECF subfamily)